MRHVTLHPLPPSLSPDVRSKVCANKQTVHTYNDYWGMNFFKIKMDSFLYGGQIKPRAKPLVDVAEERYGPAYDAAHKTMNEVCFDIVKGKQLCQTANTGTFGCCRTIVDTIC
jgi:hypothetical protein